MEPTAKMVEAGARALSDHTCRGKWETFDDDWKNEFRKAATACLRAALGGDNVAVVHKADEPCRVLVEDQRGNELAQVEPHEGDTIAIFREEGE